MRADLSRDALALLVGRLRNERNMHVIVEFRPTLAVDALTAAEIGMVRLIHEGFDANELALA